MSTTTRAFGACKDHCRTCDSCFDSTRAFDTHRCGDHETGRYCLPLEENERFEIKTWTGYCDISNGSRRQPRHVWKVREACRIGAEAA